MRFYFHPGHRPGGDSPWCYTINSRTLWENCDCNEEENYSPNCGDVTTTINGHNCQKWTSTTPHKPNSQMVNWLRYKENAIPDHNFCRAADPNDSKPWCYTTNPV